MKLNKQLWIFAFLVLLSLSFSQAYKQNPDDNTAVHQHITKEATNVWPLLPYEIKDHATNPINAPLEKSILLPVRYKSGKDIITGSAEEDVPIYEAFRHFWNPDNPQSGDYNDGLDVCIMCGADFNCQSSYRQESFWG